MENRKASHITAIERALNNKRLLKPQRETLIVFDRFNELESQCSIGTRRGYMETLYQLALNIHKPFESRTKEDLQEYISTASKHYTEATMMTRKVHIKRFFKWLEWVKANKGKSNEDKIDIHEVKAPYKVRWIKTGLVDNSVEFEDLPTEEEVRRIVSCVETQRDRALLLILWETGASNT